MVKTISHSYLRRVSAPKHWSLQGLARPADPRPTDPSPADPRLEDHGPQSPQGMQTQGPQTQGPHFHKAHKASRINSPRSQNRDWKYPVKHPNY